MQYSQINERIGVFHWSVSKLYVPQVHLNAVKGEVLHDEHFSVCHS